MPGPFHVPDSSTCEAFERHPAHEVTIDGQ